MEANVFLIRIWNYSSKITLTLFLTKIIWLQQSWNAWNSAQINEWLLHFEWPSNKKQDDKGPTILNRGNLINSFIYYINWDQSNFIFFILHVILIHWPNKPKWNQRPYLSTHERIGSQNFRRRRESAIG